MKAHSPILVGLLLTATAAVNAVVVAKLLEAGSLSRVSFVYDALINAQLAVACVWAVMGTRRSWLGWVAVLAAIGAAGMLLSYVFGPDLEVIEGCGIYGMLTALLCVALWIVRRTPLWRRLTGSGGPVTWQFSLGHLMLAMTAVAVLTTALRGSVLLFEAGDAWKSLVVFTLSDVVLVVTLVVVWVWAARLPLFPRLAAAIAPAFVVGGVNTALSQSGLLGTENPTIQNAAPFDLMAYALMVALVIVVYLEIAPLIARGESSEQQLTDAAKE